MEASGAQSVGTMIGMVIYFAVILFMIISGWKVFAKAGIPGWGIIIPIYNFVLMCKIAGKPVWWIILLLIPIVNLIIGILLTVGIAQKFGKGALFAIGLIFLPFIFWPILGFGQAKYTG